MKERAAIYFGEFLGTFLLVFIGASAVAVAVLFNALIDFVQVAAVWGLGVTLTIYATRHLSCAHLNPAVSLGMVLAGRMQPHLLLPYWASQLLGGIAAPLFGGAAASACFRFIIAPLMSARTNMVVCTCESDNSERSKG